MDIEAVEPSPQVAQEEWKMITIELMAYDVTTDQPIQKTLETTRDQDHLIFRWLTTEVREAEGTLYIGDWSEFLQVVRKREPHRWTSGGLLEGPLGEGGMESIVRQLTSTPRYQLFLACVDVIDFLGLHQQGDPNKPSSFYIYYLSRRFGELNGFIPSVIGGGKLFFVADSLLAEKESVTDQLVQNGKLVKLTMRVEGDLFDSKYYVPYSVPNGFKSPVNQAAKRLWDSIREEYYARRA